MKLIYHIGKLSEEEELRLNFLDSLSHTVEERIELGFIPMKLPIIDDEPYRIFDSTEDYRIWADQTLPDWLGYKIVDDQ